MPRLSSTILTVCLLAMPVAATAQQSPIREALKLYCTGDYLEHCSQHPPGGPEVEACFRTHLKSLSPNCAAAIGAYKRDRKTTRQITEAR